MKTATFRLFEEIQKHNVYSYKNLQNYCMLRELYMYDPKFISKISCKELKDMFSKITTVDDYRILSVRQNLIPISRGLDHMYLCLITLKSNTYECNETGKRIEYITSNVIRKVFNNLSRFIASFL